MAVKYVATTGNNGNAGTIGSPWLTPRHGIGQLAAGDTLYIRGGTYGGSGTRLFEIYFGATGTSWGAGQITVSSYPGETATLVVEGGGDNLVRFQDGSRSYIELVDLVLDGTGGMEADSGAILVYCASTSTRIRLTGVEVRNSTGTGLLIEGSFHEFINCNVHGNGTYAGYTNSNGLYCSATDCLIEGGEYWDNEAYGFRFGDSSGSHDADRNVARNVLTYQNGLGVGLGGTSTATGGGGIVVADNDNLVANCISDGDYAGIVVFGLSGKTSERNKIYNCTIHGTVTGYAIEIQALGVDTEVKNCLCYANAVNAIEDDGTTSDLSNNLDDGTDPQFIDAGAGDFRLEADSPAINAGTDLSPDVTDDYDGNTRPVGTYDIGAFEFGGSPSGSPGDSPEDSPGDSPVDGGSGSKQILSFAQIGPMSGSGNAFIRVLNPGGLPAQGSEFELGVWSATGVFRNFQIRLTVAPGFGNTATFTLRKGVAGGALSNTAITATISGTATTASYTASDIDVSDGDILSLQGVYTGSAAVGYLSFTLEFESATAGQSAYGGHSSGIANLTPRYTGAFSMKEWTEGTTPEHVQSVAACAGAITKMNIQQIWGFGAWAGSIDFHIYKNGVKQDGTGGTVDTGITCTSANNNTVVSKTFTLPISPGDTVAIREFTATPLTVPCVFNPGIQFTATTPGQSQFCGGGTSHNTGNATLYSRVTDRGAATNSSDLNIDGAITPFTLKDLHVALSVAPGSGTRVYSLRRNASNPAGTPSVTLTGSETLESDLINALAVVDGDLVSMQHVSSSSPTAGASVWGLTQEIAVDVEPEPEPEPSPGPGPGASTIGVNGIIEMCFHRGTSFRTWIKYRGGGITAKRFWWLGDVGTVDATDDMHEEPLYGAFGTYEFEPIKVRGLIPEYGLASWFDGAAQRVTTLTGLSGTGGIFTLIACIRPDVAGMGTARCIYQTGAVGSGYLGINDDDQPVFGVNGGALVTSSQTLEADHEYLLVGTYDGSSGTIFAAEHLIDATIYEDGPSALTFTAAHDIGTIGSNESTEYFTGAIQHVAELEDTLVALDVEGLHSNTFWTDVTPDVEGVLTMDRGIHDDGPLARIAATGQLRITMDNSTLNTAGLEGYYSPNHANVREGFQRGIPIRFSLFDDSSPETRLLQFIGTIKSIRPTPGIYLERRSAILATDWMDEAARSTLRGLPVMTGVTADQVVEAIINGMRNRPHEIDFQTGSDTYEIALHNTTDEGTTAMVELRKVSESELGFVYVLGDGTLVFESRSTRALLTLTYSLTDFLTVEQDDSADLAKNRVKVTVHPARVGDDPTQVLYSNDSTASPADPAIALDNGMNIEIFFPFRDLGGQETERIGATEIIEPVATSDYLLNTAEDGSGGDVTGNANIVLTWALGGNGVYLRATNGYGQRVWFTFLQIRGRAVYDFEPIELIARNDNLRDEIGEQLVQIDMPYQTQAGIGQGAADYLLNAYSTRQTRLKSVTFWGDYSGVNRVAMIYGDISTRIAASEDMSGVAGEFYINAKRIEWKPSGDEGLGDIDCTFHLADTQTAGEFWVLETSALDVNTRLAYL